MQLGEITKVTSNHSSTLYLNLSKNQTSPATLPSGAWLVLLRLLISHGLLESAVPWTRQFYYFMWKRKNTATLTLHLRINCCSTKKLTCARAVVLFSLMSCTPFPWQSYLLFLLWPSSTVPTSPLGFAQWIEPTVPRMVKSSPTPTLFTRERFTSRAGLNDYSVTFISVSWFLP